MRRYIIIPAALVVAALSLAGCSSAGGSSSSELSSASGTASDVKTAPEPASVGVKDSGSNSNAIDPVTREVVTTGSVIVKSGNPIAAADAAVTVVEEAGGRVDARTQSAATKTSTGSATLELRIPSAVLTETLARLKKLGTVESIKISAEDVTTQGQDLDARITALSTSVTRLLALEAKASDTKTLIELESAISDRQGELDSLTAQRRYLSDQVSMSSINLRLVSPSDVPATTPSTPADAFGAGLQGFGAFFVDVFLVISYLLPWLVLVGAAAFVVIVVLRRRRRRTPEAV